MNNKFGLKLYYDTPTTGGTATYNGNISGMGWGTTSSNNANADMLYRFTYNGINMLTSADFYKSGVTANGFDANYTYSHNGNLLTVNRFNKAGSYIDRITTQYTGNKINLITDLAGDIPNVIDYPGSTSQVGGFIYDQNGNLTQETNKLIYIDYNLFNLPKEVNYWAGYNKRINYYYNFDGQKLRKRFEDNGTLTKTDYCGPYVYETSSGVCSLKYLVTPFGRAIKNGSSWIYEYNLTDLPITIGMGNVRVVIHKGANNLAEVVQERHYYPFGMEMSELSYNYGRTVPNKYLYNGKEPENDYGIYLYDYGARFYDPQLGRWHSVDPLSEKYYPIGPYVYVANNPTKFIDLDGRDILIWFKKDNGEKMGTYRYTGGSVCHTSKYVQSVIAAWNYNVGKSGGDPSYEAATNSDILINVFETYGRSFHMDGTIYWNPKLGTLTDNGTILSPTTVLDHELDHGVQRATNRRQLESDRTPKSDKQYGTKEERRVVTGSEQKTARAN